MSDAASRARLETLQVENPRLQREVAAFPARSEARGAVEATLDQVAHERAVAEGELFSLRQREAVARDAQDREWARSKGFRVPWWSSWAAWVVLVGAFIAAFNALLEVDPDHLPAPAALGVVALGLPLVVNLARVFRARARRSEQARAAVRAASQAAAAQAARAAEVPPAPVAERER